MTLGTNVTLDSLWNKFIHSQMSSKANGVDEMRNSCATSQVDLHKWYIHMKCLPQKNQVTSSLLFRLFNWRPNRLSSSVPFWLKRPSSKMSEMRRYKVVQAKVVSCRLDTATLTVAWAGIDFHLVDGLIHKCEALALNGFSHGVQAILLMQSTFTPIVFLQPLDCHTKGWLLNPTTSLKSEWVVV